MARERRRELLPLVHEPRDPLLGAPPFRRDGPRPLAIGVERGIAERRADLPEPRLERVDLRLHLLQALPQRAHLSRHLALLWLRSGCSRRADVAYRRAGGGRLASSGVPSGRASPPPPPRVPVGRGACLGCEVGVPICEAKA